MLVEVNCDKAESVHKDKQVSESQNSCTFLGHLFKTIFRGWMLSATKVKMLLCLLTVLSGAK